MKIKSTLLLLTIVLYSFSQTVAWKKDLYKELDEVSWVEQGYDGTIIASGLKALVGLNNKTGEIAWEIARAKGVDKKSFVKIEETPLFLIEYTNLSMKINTLLINSVNGEVLFDSKERELSIKGHKFIAEKGIILFEVNKDKKKWILCYDVVSKTEKWMVEIGDIKGGLIGRLLATSFIDFGPFYNTQNNLLIGIDKNVFCFDFNNGKELWKYTAKKDLKSVIYYPDNNSLYLGVKKDEKLYVYDANTGTDITPGKLKLRGTLEDLVPDNNNNLIVLESEGFNILNPKTNAFLWEKSFKLEGVTEVIPHKGKYIAVASTEKESTFAYVDANGEKLWKESYSGYSYFNSPTEKGLLFITSELSNILDFVNGEKVWKKYVKLRGIPAVAFDTKENKAALYERGKLYKVDLATGDLVIVKEDIELAKGYDKKDLRAEYLPNTGYLIFDNQHTTLLKPNGDIVYTKFFEPIATIGGLMDLGSKVASAYTGMDIDIEGSMQSLNELKSMSNGNFTKKSNAVDQGTTKSSVITGMYTMNGDGSKKNTVYEITEKRYSNTQNTNTHRFITTSKHTSGPGNYIIAFNKITGNIDHSFKVDDNKPNYLIDTYENMIFINENHKVIIAYKQ